MQRTVPFLLLIVGSSQNPVPAPTLERQAAGTTQRLQAVSVVNERVVWASGTGGTWARTADGGTTWRTGVVPGTDSLEFRDVQGVDSLRAYVLAAGPGPRSRIYRTRDGGRTWRLQFRNREPEAFYDCFAFWGRSAGFVMSDAVRDTLRIMRTEDGATWRALAGPPAAKGEGGFAASGTCVATYGDSLGWIATGAGEVARVLRSANRGVTWQSVVTPIAQGTPTSGHTSVSFATPLDGIAVGGDIADTLLLRPDAVVISRDGGATWSPGGTLSFPGAAYGAAWVPGAAGLVVAVGPRGASWSRNGGQTWLALDTLSHWSVAFASRVAGWMVGPAGRVTKVRLP